jgi:hypothetical protein
VRHGQRVLELARDPERAREVAAGSAVDDCELGALGAGEAVDDLVDRSVAADGNEQACAAGNGSSGEVGEVPGPFREERVALQAASGRDARDLGPAAAGASAVGGRVDEEDGFAANARTSRS